MKGAGVRGWGWHVGREGGCLMVYETHLETLQAEKDGDARLGKGAAHAGCSLVVPSGHGSGSEGARRSFSLL